ncbi:Methyltransferase-like protein 5 [Datura stramonium]|uniref:Methyltransferase-like protein 5 n=1 Tax=Datura stramonium TaxID=4076 RepID=A0ABS8UY62_DATST|nr:Methyltransferase-like protein 5 [Datura stramonium]
MEEVAEKCVKDLIDRNLISIHRVSSFDGKIKACGMHDMIRELCLREARNIHFVNVLMDNQNPNEQARHDFSTKCRSLISIQSEQFNSASDQLAMFRNSKSHSVLLSIRKPSSSRIMQECFPRNLKKLAFTGTCLPWEDLRVVGKLPKLEALKLAYDACVGEEWRVFEEGFPQLLLQHLCLCYWRASSDHFPHRERLVLDRCWYMDSIPQDFAEITTLELIDISDCAESVGNSAKKFLQEIEDNYGSSSVEVCIS